MNDEMKQNDQPTESLVKYIQRSGTNDSGRDYEAKILALIALRCVRQDFEDVWLGTNVDEVGDFDDIILQVKKPSEDSRCTFMFQLKHADKPKHITKREFMPDIKIAGDKSGDKIPKGDFSLPKYAETFSKLIAKIQSSSADDIVRNITNSNTTFLLFTNRGTNVYPFLESCPISSFDFLNTSKSQNVYKFDFDKLERGACLNNIEYCKNIRLFTNQMDVNKVDNLIAQELTNVLDHLGITNKNNEGTTREFKRFIKYWKNGNFGCNFYLTKQCILDKLCELLLCQYAVDFLNGPVIFYASDREKLWSKIITDKYITIMDHTETTSKFLARYIGSEVQHYIRTSQNWSDVLSREEKSEIYQNLNLKTIILRSIGKHKSINILDIYKGLWLNGSLPLLLKIGRREAYEDIIKVLEVSLYKFKVIISNKSIDAMPDMHVNVPHFFTLSDLKEQERTDILELPIKLQGSAFSSFKILIDESMMRLINASDVINILTDNFNIGNEYPQSLDLDKIFISRSLSKIIFKHNVVNLLEKEKFVIECPFNITKNNFKFLHENAIICNEKDSSNEVEKLKSNSKVIHRLTFYSREYFAWKETIGSIKNICRFQFIQESGLYQYVELNPILKTLPHNIDHFWIPVENILDNSNPHLLNKLNIIDAGPGMGKTTLLDFVARSSDLWTVKIYLSDHYEYFKEIKRTSPKLKALDHLQRLNDLIFMRCNYSNNTLSQKVFQKLLDQKMVFILIDGFDEISVSYKNEVTQMIKTLLKKGCPTWITTRSIMKSYLEEEFNTISVTLKPFNANEQTKFLRSYFTQECIKNISKDVGKYSFLIQEFVNQLLNAARINLNDDDIEFSGFPLQIKLLAEVFSDKFKESLNSKIIDFNDRFDLLYLYKEFFNKKHEIFYEKHGPTARDMHPLFQCHQQLFALKFLFRREDLSELNIDKKLNDYYKNKDHKPELLQRDGIIVVDQIGSSSNSKFSIRFIHRSFAEYLAAEWLAVNITSDSKRNKRTAHNLAKKRFDQNLNLSLYQFITTRGISYYRFLFEVFDRMVSEDHNLHLAIINRHFIDVKHIIKSNPDSVTKVDKCGRTILHMAALYGVSHFPRFTGFLPVPDQTVDIIDQIPQSSVWEMNKDILGYDPLYCAIANNTLAVADKICEKSTINLIIHNSFETTSREMYIMYCVVLKYKSLFKLLLSHFAFRDLLQRNVVKDMSIKDYCNHLSNNRLSSPDLLTDFIAEYTNQTIWSLCSSVISPPEKYYTELGLAAAFGSMKNIRKLLKKHPTLINFQDTNKNTALHYAVIHKRLEVVKLLLTHGADVSKAGCNNNTPLHFAVQSGQKELVEKLLLKRIHIDQLNGNNNSPLYLAVAVGDMDILNLLLSKGADCNVGSDREGNSCLHYCCGLERVDIAKALLLKRADVNSLNFSKETPLHLAVRNRGTELVKLLLDYNANACIIDRNGFLPLHKAVESGNADVVDLLLKARENQKQQFDETPQYFRRTADTKINTTLMHLAVINRRVTITECLLSHGESCNIVDINQRTPLHYAAERGYDDIVHLLLSKNANVNMQDANGDIAVHLALLSGQFAIANTLLSKTKTNIKNADGNSVLHYAVASDDKDIILRVLSEGADINCLNSRGDTPLNFAIISTVVGGLKTIKLLLSKGAKCDIFNQLGYSPIHSAAYFGKIELLHPLLDHHNNASLPNQRNQTPLHFSMIDNVMFTEEGLENQKQVVRLLLDRGANCNICDFMGNTVLHYASIYNTRSCYTLASEEMKKCLQHFHKCIVQLLISRGADKTIKNQEGFTAESLASKWGCTDMVGLLH